MVLIVAVLLLLMLLLIGPVLSGFHDRPVAEPPHVHYEDFAPPPTPDYAVVASPSAARPVFAPYGWESASDVAVKAAYALRRRPVFNT